MNRTTNIIRRNEAGFTLNEVLAALMITTLIMGVATALFISFQSMWTNSSNGHTLDAEKKQLSSLLSGKLAASTQAEISQNRIAMTTEEGQVLQLNFSNIPGSNLQKLTYTITGSSPTTFTISEHVASATYNGADLRNIMTSSTLANGESLHLVVHFQWGKATEVLDTKLKLLNSSIINIESAM